MTALIRVNSRCLGRGTNGPLLGVYPFSQGGISASFWSPYRTHREGDRMFFFSNFARVASKHDREALFGVFRVMKRKAAVSAILVMLLAVSTLSYAETGSIQITFVRAGRFIEGTGNLFYETNKYRFDISGLDTTLIRVRKLYLVGAALN